MKNVFQELIKSANKEDQANCKTKDSEEFSNRRNRRFLKKEVFSGYPSNTSYDREIKKN